MTGIVYSFIRYLSAKKSVDDRAINRPVWEALRKSLPETSADKPLRVLEIGSGTGTMVQRMIDWGLVAYAEYTGIDAQQRNVSHAQLHLPIWAEKQGFIVEHNQPGATISGSDFQFKYLLEAVDLQSFLALNTGRRSWDLILAHAFLDLIDVKRMLPQILDLCKTGGQYYFSLNYDGLTILEPAIKPGLDQQILTAYNKTMDERLVDGKPSGDHQTGRHLFTNLAAAGGQLIASGSSDWVVFPGPNGYLEDEAYFLHCIINTILEALKDYPGIEQDSFKEWIAERHAQIDREELVYIAHQIDFAGKVSR